MVAIDLSRNDWSSSFTKLEISKLFLLKGGKHFRI